MEFRLLSQAVRAPKDPGIRSYSAKLVQMGTRLICTRNNRSREYRESASRTQWPIYNSIAGNEHHQMPKVYENNIAYHQRATSEQPTQYKQSKETKKTAKRYTKSIRDNNWLDLVNLHDHLREVASKREKINRKHIQKLQMEYLDKQIEKNKEKRTKESIEQSRNGWNTINENMHKSSHFAAFNQYQKNLTKDQDGANIYGWGDPSLKYLKKEIKGQHEKRYSVDSGVHTGESKHILYPLLNKSRRKQFYKNLAAFCNKENHKLSMKKSKQKKSDMNENLKEFDKRYNRKLIKLMKSQIDGNEDVVMPGTKVGDSRMHLQLAKYIENDKEVDNIYSSTRSLNNKLKSTDKYLDHITNPERVPGGSPYKVPSSNPNERQGSCNLMQSSSRPIHKSITNINSVKLFRDDMHKINSRNKRIETFMNNTKMEKLRELKPKVNRRQRSVNLYKKIEVQAPKTSLSIGKKCADPKKANSRTQNSIGYKNNLEKERYVRNLKIMKNKENFQKVAQISNYRKQSLKENRASVDNKAAERFKGGNDQAGVKKSGDIAFIGKELDRRIANKRSVESLKFII
ncbi:unnamed protein product [Moneuplotes crassus]|uniref:Uncharacterized protein n=1 Tax=Euplotes crassus TaxID=5936 RepID=A0AAD1U529_EUPCR|nr:unnamed protein product [Moneuplotes crassus]